MSTGSAGGRLGTDAVGDKAAMRSATRLAEGAPIANDGAPSERAGERQGKILIAPEAG